MENHLAALKGIQLTMTVEDLAKIPLPLYTAINGFLNKNNTNGLVLHAVNSKLIESDYECIYINIFVNHRKVIAILDTGAPDNIVSSKLVKAMKISPDLPFNKVFGIAGPNTTQAQGAYSGLTLKIGRLMIQTPAIVFKNKSYDILLGSSFLKKSKCKIDLETDTFYFLGEQIPMFYKKGLPNEFERKKNWVGVKYTTGVLPVQYSTTGSNIPLIPQTVAAMDGIHIRASKSTKIPPHHQRLIETGLNFKLPEGTFGE